MEMDGGNQQQLTNGYDIDPFCSPDGRWIAYASGAGALALWKVAIDGGQPVQLTDKWARYPAISPDGKQIACAYRDEPDTPPKLAIIPSDGGQPTKIIALPQGRGFASGLRWTPDARAVVYVDTRGGVSNLWAQPVDGSQPKQLTDFKTDRIFSFDFARDGKQLVLARGTTTDDVVLISDLISDFK
jgi:Tol biopolymer transport system component